MGLPGAPGIEGMPAVGEELPPLLPGLLRELLLDEELLDEDELRDEDELLDGIELLLVGIWTVGGWLLEEVVLHPPARDASTRGIRSWRVFTSSTCTSR